jgi:minor histocompatibility antigen H13
VWCGGVGHSAFDREADEQGGDAARPQSLADLGERAFFLNTLGAYGGGLVFAFAVNYVTKAGQPALLYLVPATLGASVAVALRRGELSRLLAFEDKTKRDSFVDL